MFKAFIQYHFRDAEHAKNTLVTLGAALGLIGTAIAVVGIWLAL